MWKIEKSKVLVPETLDAAKLWFVVPGRPESNSEFWLPKILRMKTIFISIMLGERKHKITTCAVHLLLMDD